MCDARLRALAFTAGHAAAPLPKPSDVRDVSACRVETMGTGLVGKDGLVRAALLDASFPVEKRNPLHFRFKGDRLSRPKARN